MRAIQATTPGGPEVLELVDVPMPTPGPGEVLVRVEHAGVNFIDTYRRSGMYPMPFPHISGAEGAGTVTQLGAGVTGIEIGDLIAWADVLGSYAEYVVVPADRALIAPPKVDPKVAAALPLQGLTAHYLINSAYPAQPGQTILLHAGAGGVGLLLTQLAVAKGITVISTVSTQAKAELARAAGASEVIRYDQLADLATELPALVRELSGGGVPVVYDGVGKSTFDASLASLTPRGMLVLYGAASGAVPPFDLQRLNAGGSLYVTRPSLVHYIAATQELRERAGDLFAAIADGTLNVRVGAEFELAEAAEAHRALEGRHTTGKVLLNLS